MLIGVLSDTHDCLPMIARAIGALRARGVEHVLHAGDFVAPFAVKALAGLGVPVTAVIGNNDGEIRGITACFASFGHVHRRYAKLDLGGRRILMMHEPEALCELVKSGSFDLVVYGHTHELHVDAGPPVVLNPGEACGYVTGRGTVAVVDLATMAVEVIDL
jgi:uncharacterized protein